MESEYDCDLTMRPIELRGARTHNLRNIDLVLAPGNLVVIAGPSGAGKSSLAFGTLYAEGQRRYVESFSAYARQFLERLERPPVDALEPVPAAVSVDRRAPVRTSRSTVATMTELSDYAKSLWARAAVLHCAACQRPVRPDTPARAAQQVLAGAPGARVVITFPVPVQLAEPPAKRPTASAADAELLDAVKAGLMTQGYGRVYANGAVRAVDEITLLEDTGPAAPATATGPGPAAGPAGEPTAAVGRRMLDVVADRAVARADRLGRLVEAIEAAMRHGSGRADVHVDGRGDEAVYRFSNRLHCAHCDIDYRPATPGLFSFNSPIGACETCRGFGRVIGLDVGKVIPDPGLSLAQGAIKPWRSDKCAWERGELKKHGKRAGVPWSTPVAHLDPAQRAWLMDGDDQGWMGVRGWFSWIESQSYKMHMRVFLARYRSYDPCPACAGTRLKPEALWWRIDGHSVAGFLALSVDEALAFLDAWKSESAAADSVGRLAVGFANCAGSASASETADQGDAATALLLRECTARLEALRDVGLGYLTLDRASRTLSGGEAQRVALTSALGASLAGAMIVLDEPTVGLHPADVSRLFGVVRNLATADNVVLVVEHDAAVLRGADRVVELGPGAGEHGGRIVFDGPPADLLQADTATGRALRENVISARARRSPHAAADAQLAQPTAKRTTQAADAQLAQPTAKRTTQAADAQLEQPTAKRTTQSSAAWLRLRGARGNNLAGVDLDIPRGTLTCVTGVSGSGKSSLVLDTLGPAAAHAVGQERGGDAVPDASPAALPAALPYGTLTGTDGLTGVVVVDQAPLGRTARGNPATYVKAWDWFRKLLADQPLAVERGYKPGTFSFNVPGGRCEACKGEGAETVEMQFLADVSFSCPECGGKRFVGDVLDVRCEGKNAAELLDMTVHEALALFPARKLRRALGPVAEVGLGYLRLGQPLSTLSGGEAQRLKLAEALSQAAPGSLVLIDEPTAGLHPVDIEPLLQVLDALAERGDTVVVIEHDMRVAAHADWIIDMGPGAGAHGGQVVAAGTPEQVATHDASVTAAYLAATLGIKRPAPPVWQGTSSRASEGLVPATSTRVRTTRSGHASTSSERHEAQASPAHAGTNPAPAGANIEITGAHEHNLQNVSVTLPRERLVVVTGPSGSGKSTLAFDVLYAEGQRRYLETLSPYARQYMPRLPRPAVDRVVGVPPSVALEQRITGGGANSTVATITEVAHYLRVLYAKAGRLHCPRCQLPIEPRPPVALAQDLRGAGPLTVLAPVVRGRKGMHKDLLARARKRGMERARIDGVLTDITPGMALSRFHEHDIELVVAAVDGKHARLTQAIEQAAALSGGSVHILGKDRDLLLSTKRACPGCGTGYPELDPRMFSFNTRQGACETCEGRGTIFESAVETAPATTRKTAGKRTSRSDAPAHPPAERHRPCPACGGTRLSPLARAVTVAGQPITDILACSVDRARALLAKLTLHGRDAEIAAVPLAEAASRLRFLDDVGVGYLSLDRSARTLSGGEIQRVRLAAQLGSGLTGVLYVLDEPTIGLHPHDTGALLASLRALVDRGNSLVVVEHDTDTIRAADHVLDIGPGGGRHGGRVVAQGTIDDLRASPTSVTGPALDRPAPIPAARRPTGVHPWLRLRGGHLHNLRDVDADIPLGCLVTVTGVSGSGKTTLVREVLMRAVAEALGQAPDQAPGQSDDTNAPDLEGSGASLYRSIEGSEHLRRAVEIDQSPIGRTSRSVPATYVGIWNEIRKLLAATPEARARGYGASRFSFNTAEGRCPICEGQGLLTAEMAFLPDVRMPCDACGGLRFAPDTLEVTWRGHSAGALLDLDVADAIDVFASVSKVVRPLRLLADLGLGYLKLGQASSTLSGGEAQRLKLVAELGTRSAGGTLYIMDEPTTGLHRDDVARLIQVLHRLVDRGDTVVVIEHHTDIMLAADWLIDMGPDGGAGGGRVVASGTPETVARRRSHTARVLADILTHGQAGALAQKPPASR